jgi:hypothetical protein
LRWQTATGQAGTGIRSCRVTSLGVAISLDVLAVRRYRRMGLAIPPRPLRAPVRRPATLNLEVFTTILRHRAAWWPMASVHGVTSPAESDRLTAAAHVGGMPRGASREVSGSFSTIHQIESTARGFASPAPFRLQGFSPS